MLLFCSRRIINVCRLVERRHFAAILYGKWSTHSLVMWLLDLFDQNTDDPTSLSTTTAKEGVTARQRTFSASTEQTLKPHRTIAHLSGRQAASMHYRAPKTPRGSWMCTIYLLVAERATFVESGNQPTAQLTLFWLGCLPLCAKS